MMKTFEESEKSKKTVKSMIENKKEESTKKSAKGKENKPVKSMYSSLFYFLCLWAEGLGGAGTVLLYYHISEMMIMGNKGVFSILNTV